MPVSDSKSAPDSHTPPIDAILLNRFTSDMIYLDYLAASFASMLSYSIPTLAPEKRRPTGLRVLCTFSILLTLLIFPLQAASTYILPQAAGNGDGSSWENAAAAPAPDKWTALVARLSPGDTLHIGSGSYENVRFAIGKGGREDAPITLLGEDTGAGLPVFHGSWKKENPASGEILCTIRPGVGFVVLKNFRVRNCLAAIVTSGGNHGLTISGLDVRDVRLGIVFKNNAVRSEDPNTWTRNVLVENSNFTGFTKSALRWEGGNRDFRIINCHGDAGGKDYFTEPFHMVFLIRGDERKNLPENSERAHDQNFLFENCTARNAYHEAPSGKGYWNGDGFTAERGVRNITFVNCAAFDCTDGGWDLKADDVTFKNCIAFRNKRNIRIWGSATFENCIVGFPEKRGGSGGTANFGIYTSGNIALKRCTLVSNLSQFNIEKITSPNSIVARLTDCLIVFLGKDTPELSKQIALDRTTVINQSNAPAASVFKAPPSAEWEGKDTNFDPQSAFAGKGYHSGE